MASMNGMVWIALGGGVLLYLVYSSQAGAPAPAPVASAAAAPPQTVSPSCTNFAPCTCPSGYSMVTSGPGPSGAPVTGADVRVELCGNVRAWRHVSIAWAGRVGSMKRRFLLCVIVALSAVARACIFTVPFSCAARACYSACHRLGGRV
jgi:hypothetical protein